jgi:hypothetical protein
MTLSLSAIPTICYLPRLLVLLQAFPFMFVDWKNTEWVKKKEEKKVDQVDVLATWC